MDKRKIKSRQSKTLHKEIMKSMIASFRIDGTTIPIEITESVLRKIEFDLKKHS